jgi:hypothetical protein
VWKIPDRKARTTSTSVLSSSTRAATNVSVPSSAVDVRVASPTAQLAKPLLVEDMLEPFGTPSSSENDSFSSFIGPHDILTRSKARRQFLQQQQALLQYQQQQQAGSAGSYSVSNSSSDEGMIAAWTAARRSYHSSQRLSPPLQPLRPQGSV